MNGIRFLILSLMLSGCNFLEKDPVNAVHVDDLFETKSDVNAALTGCYEILTSSYGYFSGRLGVVADVATNNIEACEVYPEFYDINRMIFKPTNEVFYALWSDLYEGINRTNTLIEKLPDSKIPGLNYKNEILGQAHFLRAFHYFNLVQYFGSVPLITTTTSTIDIEKLNVSRASVTDVYTQIYEDLYFAIDNLPALYSSNKETKGKATKGAALALLARIQLYVGNHQNAIETANELLELGVYNLTPDYSSLFEAQLTSESIWEIQFSFQKRNDLVYNYAPATKGGWGWLKPSTNLINTYEVGDQRKTPSVADENDPFVKKFFRLNTGEDNFIVVRLAEIILIKAEALAEVNYPNVEALDLLNVIRERAALAPLTLDQVPTISEFRQLLHKERRVELAFEGHYWHDLVRTGQLSNYISPDQQHLYLMPIPQSELDRNLRLTQNPGY